MRSNTEWRLWGAEDPLFGVATWQSRERGGSNPWTDAEFYALGDDWLDFQEHWRRYGLTPGVVVEIGCGAGRITHRMAETFSSVIACDVSSDILRYARERVIATNIDWRTSDGATIPVNTGTAHAVFSCHVLQHLDSNTEQLRVFTEIYRVLRPGGTFLIHIPLHLFPPFNVRFSRYARKALSWFLVASRLKAEVRRLAARPLMRGTSYELKALHNDLLNVGFQRVEFCTFPVRTNDDLHSCVLGTKL